MTIAQDKPPRESACVCVGVRSNPNTDRKRHTVCACVAVCTSTTKGGKEKWSSSLESEEKRRFHTRIGSWGVIQHVSHRWWVPVATHHLWSMLLARWDNPREGGRGSRSGPHARSESSSLFLFLRGCFRSFVWCHFSGSRFSRWYYSAAFASNGPGGKETGTRIFGRGFSFSSFRRMSSYVLIFALLLRLKICVVDTFDHFSALARLWSFFFHGLSRSVLFYARTNIWNFPTTLFFSSGSDFPTRSFDFWLIVCLSWKKYGLTVSGAGILNRSLYGADLKPWRCQTGACRLFGDCI